MNPKVSVIMPCYNEPADVFRRSLESAIAQTLEDIEIIIILDNPENKELEAIIGEYQKSCDKILLLTPEKNLGRGDARNLGIQFAEGEYIAIHDADDVDMPERLEEQYNYMEENPEIDVVFSEVKFVDMQGTPIFQDIPLCANRKNGSSFFTKKVNHTTMFVRKSAMDLCGYKNLNFAEDLDMWMQLFEQDKKFGYTNTIHTHYLAPYFSSHSEYVEKMKGWKIGAMKVMLLHITTFYKDPYLYGKFGVAFSDYIMLHFGENTYKKYRNFLSSASRKISSIKR